MGGVFVFHALTMAPRSQESDPPLVKGGQGRSDASVVEDSLTVPVALSLAALALLAVLACL